MRALLVSLAAGAVIAAGYLVPHTPTAAAPPRFEREAPAAAPTPRLVAHEWGTFTSFGGSDGVPLAFTPNNEDLPNFVYYPTSQFTKSGRLARGGLVSMETPVVYFYADREQKVSVKVDFPRGWITEWYPSASAPPVYNPRQDGTGGESIKWDIKLTPGEAERYPVEANRNEKVNHYYYARETDATPLQAEVTKPVRGDELDGRVLRGGSVLQREKFLFYRGVGTFAPPVTVKALGGDRVTVVNNSGGVARGLVLVTVRGGKLGFRPLPDVEPGATAAAQLPQMGGTRADLVAHVVEELTRTGLYKKEAAAMVKTWDSAWFGEEGTRLLYFVPRAKTDALLPIAIDPKPTELVRVLVGRHDFLTPEAEATADAQLKRLLAAEKERQAALKELATLGRFSPEAQQQAAKRLDGGPK